MTEMKGFIIKTILEDDIRIILKELVRRVDEVKSRKDQPDFSKGLDIFCDYEEAVTKILDRTAALELYEELKKALRFIEGYALDEPLPAKLELRPLREALTKAEGK